MATALSVSVAGFAFAASGGISSSKEEPLTAKQAALAAQFKTAPERSIVLFDENSTTGYALVCKSTKADPVRLAYVGFFGTSPCGMRHLKSWVEAVQRDPVKKIITPTDPEYSGLLERRTMHLLGEDEAPQ
ncbi:MAG: hypothetical protein V4480_00915 [Patescibacteria group bacterium]